MKSNLGIYVHIPFCVRKCHYCDFLSAPASENVMARYVECLGKEIAMAKENFSMARRKADTVFIGGGTPSILSCDLMAELVEQLQKSFPLAEQTEFSMECNPGTVTREKLQCYRSLGINRLSIGMQSAIEEELYRLGRIHSYEECRKTYEMARDTGFENMNIDIMSAIPGQTVESYLTTLQRAVKLQPEHISSYSLIIEEGTPFYEKYAEKPPVDEETDREMYQLTGEILHDAGYERYEISNYASKGRECRHNMKYWNREEYLGFGLGAASFFGHRRFSNVRSLPDYERYTDEGRIPLAETEELSQEEEMAEFMFLGLRCMRGISRVKFEEEFHRDIHDVYGKQLEQLCGQGLIREEGERISLTSRGIDVSNLVFAEFI